MPERPKIDYMTIGSEVTQENIDQLTTIVDPIIAVLGGLDSDMASNVVCSILGSYGLLYANTEDAIRGVAEETIRHILRARARAKEGRKPN